MSLSSDGTRRVKELASVTGRFENDRAEIETLWRWNVDKYEPGIGVIGSEEKFSAAGIPIESWWKR
jgi:pilus assembly protein CpaF